MTNKEAIEWIETIKEDGYSHEVVESIEVAIKSLEREEKYRWHDMTKNYLDVPEETNNKTSETVLCKVLYEGILGKYGIWYETGFYDYDCYDFHGACICGKVLAWRYIDAYEEGG